MIVPDKEIREILPAMNFETGAQKPKFDPAISVQPCSIDLRLDNVFWEPKGRRLRPLDFLEIQTGSREFEKNYRRKELGSGETILLRPGRMIMGRTLERFTLPCGYAGKLEGRSTFARLGLSIHCTGDFINPGWRGKMPMQLVNHSSVPIRLTPYLPLCQLIVMKLNGPSEKKYGDEGLDSKYHLDDGEPSKYWKDAK